MIDQVRAAAPHRFEALRGRATGFNIWQSTLRPSGATRAEVALDADQVQGVWAATWSVALPAYDHLDELAIRVERCLGARGERYKFTNDPVDDAEQWPGNPAITVTASNAAAGGELQLMIVTERSESQ